MDRFILKIEKGKTDCADCPFGSFLYGEEYVCSIPCTIDIDCGEYDLSTMMVTEKMEEQDMENKLKEYIWQDFRKSNIPKYYKYFDEWYNNLTDIQKYYWGLRMSGKICQL